jgi:L-fuculose-phosphate aldolase
MWLAVELETLAKQYYLSLAIGGPVLLSAAEIADVREGFASYGLKSEAGRSPSARPLRRRGRGSAGLA